VWKAIRESKVFTGLEKTLPRVSWHCVGLNTQENGCRCSPERRGGWVIQRRSKKSKNDMHSKIKGVVITINFGVVNCLLTPLRGVNGNGAKVQFINPRSPRNIRAVLPSSHGLKAPVRTEGASGKAVRRCKVLRAHAGSSRILAEKDSPIKR